jgi:hypothetical protein
MKTRDRLKNDRGHIGTGLHVLILFSLLIFLGCAANHKEATPGKSMSRDAGKSIASNDLSSDPLTRILALKQDKPSFNIDIWTDKKRYRVGEGIRFSFRTDRNCYLTLIDFETNGNVKVLFPNRYCQDNFIRVGKTYTIPGSEYGFKLIIEPPSGIEKIKAIATTEPFSLFDLDFENNFFPTVEKTNTRGMRSINTALDKLPNFDWAESMCTISIR